jgi:hypothetical protein
MQMTTVILLGGAIVAYAFVRLPKGTGSASSQRLKWWEKLVGAVAVVLAVLIVLNPELLALGVLGDTAFFDLLVLLLSLQLRMALARAWGFVARACSGLMRWWTPRLSYLLVLSTVAAIGNAVAAVQKLMHRISS